MDETKISREKLREKLLLYAVTDRKTDDIGKFLGDIEKALEGGITLLQLREKNLCDSELVNLSHRVLSLCRKYGVPLIINDRADIAAEIGADGVHVGIEDESVAEIRKKYGGDMIIGATAKTVTQAKKAEESGADYLGVGAVFPSPTKKNALRISREMLYEITSSVIIPSAAIGGINEENILSLEGGGMSGFAVVSAVFSADDIKTAAERMKKLAERCLGI